MATRMSWEKIKAIYPNEWVAITNVEEDFEVSDEQISGEVLVHDRDENLFTRQIKQVPINKNQVIDIRFTGDLLPDNPIGPILWQISTTNS